MLVRDRQFRGFADDARKAIVENPDYFVWWYTAKSIGLGLLFGAFCYQLGKSRSRRATR